MNDRINKDLGRLTKNITNDPTNGYYWLEYGDFLMNEYDNPTEICKAYEKAQALIPDKDLSLRLGEAYDKAGNTEKGIKIILKALSKKPRPSGFCILADIYLNNDMFDEAIKCCRKALKLDLQYEEAYYLLGLATKNKSEQKAIEYFKKAIEIDNEYHLAWQELGILLIKNASTRNDGINALKISITIEPNDGWSYIYLANALWQNDRFVEANKFYKSAISIFPDFPELRQWHNDFLNKCEEKGVILG